jgi:AbrB family looped-hinge helix DNA binding protein
MANKTTIGTTKHGQYLITIPKAIGESMRLKKGDKLEFLFDRGDVIIRKV